MGGRKKVIALVFPPVPSYGRKLTLGIAERHLAHHDWTIIEVPRLFPGVSPFADGGVQPDGVIVWAEARDLWIHDLLAQNVPVVNCGMEWTGVHGVASVHYDFSDIYRRIISHFRELGFKRVTAIGHLLDMRPATRKTLEDFVKLAEDSGLESRLWELDGEDSPSVMPRRLLTTAREAHLAAFLKDLQKPAAIFSFGDHIGYIVAAVAAHLGIRIPKSIAIAGFGDNMVAGFSDPPLTTIDGSAHEVGRAAVDCLAQWLDCGEQPFVARSIPGAVLIERESSVGKSGSVVLESVHRHIDTHSKTGVSLDELVAMSGLSVKTLVRKYREHFGLDPMEDIHQRRLHEAQRLLAIPSMPIANIATACGFSSQGAFANYFHRHAGCAPGEYRKQKIADVAQ